MKIAFDVKGTLDGHRQDVVLSLLEYLIKNGHECTVWSNSGSYAFDKAKELGLHFDMKYSLTEAQDWDKTLFDLAVEDDITQTWLAAKSFAFVHDLPDNCDWGVYLNELFRT